MLTLSTPVSAQHRSVSDGDLVAAVQVGDLAAYGVLYQRHRDLASRVAWRLARDRFDAEELVADAFAGVLAAIRAGHRPERFRAYLLAALRHRAYAALAERARHPVVLLDPDLPVPGTEPLDPGTVDATRRAFRALRPRFRAALWLSAVEGVTPAELAARWASTPNAMAALTCRARRAFRIAYARASA